MQLVTFFHFIVQLISTELEENAKYCFYDKLTEFYNPASKENKLLCGVFVSDKL